MIAFLITLYSLRINFQERSQEILEYIESHATHFNSCHLNIKVSWLLSKLSPLLLVHSDTSEALASLGTKL